MTIATHTRLTAMAISLSALMLSLPAASQAIEAMTYNIRFDNPDDGENAWDLRKAGLVDQLKFYEPDLFGIQEGEVQQVRYIAGALPEFAWVGVGREDGKSGGEFSAIFYDTRRLKVLDEGTFWLSATPAVPSLGWDAAINRVAKISACIERCMNSRLSNR